SISSPFAVEPAAGPCLLVAARPAAPSDQVAAGIRPAACTARLPRFHPPLSAESFGRSYEPTAPSRLDRNLHRQVNLTSERLELASRLEQASAAECTVSQEDKMRNCAAASFPS